MADLGGISGSCPTGQAPTGLDGSRCDPGREIFEFEEWNENAFHTIEVQACSKTQTVQFACGDYSGDYHGENPSGVALALDDAEALACFVLDQITAIRALLKEQSQ